MARQLAIAANRFVSKAAIVAGGASGIGQATVERLASEGANVAIFDINAKSGRSLAEELQSSGKAVDFFEVDVVDKGACAAATEEFAAKNRDRINYLVNSVAYFGSKSLDATSADWNKSFTVNVQGYSNMVQSCYGPMKSIVGEGGKAVVNVASISSFRAQPRRWTYAATKGAIAIMTKCMALDLSAENIRVNSVSPAWVWSPEVAKAAVGGRSKWEPIWGPFHMTRRLAETAEVAAAICFLLSDDASFITGTDLPVDGGYMSMSAEGLGENSAFAGTSDSS